MKQLTVNPERVFKFLFIIVLLLTAAGYLGEYIKNFYSYEQYKIVKQYVRIFNLGEGTVQTWFSSTLFFCCAFLLMVIAYIKRKTDDRFILHWTFLSLLFVVFSIDEYCELHERLSLFHINLGSGVFKFTWVLSAIPLVLILFFIYLKFIKHLPREIEKLVVIAAVLFISGTLVLEIVGGVYLAVYKNMGTFLIFGTLEELLELLGTTVFLYALIRYMNSHMKELRIYVENNGPINDIDLPVREVRETN
ncbi:MAG: hypothetical protein ACR2NW_08555 [Thermodesulfobacteriota bacterium]